VGEEPLPTLSTTKTSFKGNWFISGELTVVTAPLLPGPKGNFLSGNLPEFSHELGFLTMSARNTVL